MDTRLVSGKLNMADDFGMALVVGGEVALLAAVIRTAIRDWLILRDNKSAKNRRLAERARRWIFDSEGSPTSFDNYCNLVGADPDLIRERVRNTAVYLGCREDYVIRRRYPVSSQFSHTAVS